jgi:hypothetical protein
MRAVGIAGAVDQVDEGIEYFSKTSIIEESPSTPPATKSSEPYVSAP